MFDASLFRNDNKSSNDRNVGNNGIIEEAYSVYNSSVLLVKKRNWKYSFYADFRALNNITELKPCIMPTAGETLDCLNQANLFTILDLRSIDR